MTTSTTAMTAASPEREEREPFNQPEPLAGFRHQLRFMVRRDRLRMPIWVVSVVGLVGISAASVISIYSTPEDMQSYADVARADAAIKALTGPGYGLDAPTQGAIVMNETSLYTYIGVAVMCVFMIVRHTRAEEDTGRAELVRAAPVGRYATLAAATIWVSSICAAIGVGLMFVLVANGLPWVGSAAFAAANFAIGVVFIGVAAVTSQISSTSRAANSIAGAVLGVSFVLRAVGDMGNGWMTWLSPLGITQAIRPYADERWWVLVPLALLANALLLSAVFLLARRDLGAGLIRQRAGRAEASRHLASPFALALRLQRTSVIGWTAAIGLLGFFMGLIADQAEALAENEAIADMLAQAGQGTITESFLATLVLTNALLASGFTVSAVLRLRTEELEHRADTLLATPISRRQWLWSHFGVAVAGSFLVMLVSGILTGAGYAASAADAGEILPLVGASLAMMAALAVVAAVTVALVGFSAKWSIVAWTMVVIAVLVGFLAETLKLPQWVRDLSPFEHVPGMPAAPFELAPILVLVALAVALTALGTTAFRRRDIG